jgi:hypothetical protein
VGGAQIVVTGPDAFAAIDQAVPLIDRMAAGDLDDVGPVGRVEGRAVDQSGEDLQAVAADPLRPVLVEV